MTDDISRNKDATQQRILAAAAQILSAHGLAALGVNNLAKAALCDKKLIYRYFGGLDGVIAALGQDVAQRFVDALDQTKVNMAEGWRGFELALLDGLLAAYRADPLLARLRAAEMASQDSGFAPFAQARAALLQRWIAQHRPRNDPPPHVDLAAFNAAMIGAVESAVISATNSGSFAGMSLSTATEWQRYDQALKNIVLSQFPV